MQILAAVRAAGDGQLDFGEAEASGCPARDEGQGLERLGGGAQVGDRLRLAEAGYQAAFAVHGRDVPAVARLDDRPAPDFDERRGLRDVLTLFSTHRRNPSAACSRWRHRGRPFGCRRGRRRRAGRTPGLSVTRFLKGAKNCVAS